ncbi:VWA domain-containing protein [Streptomyces somaliensis DSM 40738]|uniref:VWA domain-containing protein n=1 Tax=Streptomyces somaliensis (strain ATCC 33201 / DSM 40738 / JCM 12659 / KCTC 9044 / NCTC 11332 / NRRL B-12077 / IP 733) TaxID=1134445 RepID=A0AA44ID67_STRE0|nr:VWA domain-containing protein [Streptomyces somaliensis DSM 40738]
MLRKVFGRDREAGRDESTATPSVPPQAERTVPQDEPPTVPSQAERQGPTPEEVAAELVAASFDNPKAAVPAARADSEEAPDAGEPAAQPSGAEAAGPGAEGAREAGNEGGPKDGAGAGLKDRAEGGAGDVTGPASGPAPVEEAGAEAAGTAGEPADAEAAEPTAAGAAPQEPEAVDAPDSDGTDADAPDSDDADGDAVPAASAPEAAPAPEGGVGREESAPSEPEAAAPEATATVPEAEAEPAPEPGSEAASPENVPGRDAAGPEPEDEGGQPAVALRRVRAVAPAGVVEAYKAAGAVLRKRGLTGTRAAVYLVLDRSGSMRPYYKDGSAQQLGERVLALAAHLDEDATVPVVFFSTEVDGTGDLTLDNAEGRIDALHEGLGRMGRTNYDRAVREVLAHHEGAHPDRPALVVFQTDGAPESRTAATQALAEAAATGRPVFWQFVAFGEEDGKAFDYLRKLDVDNAAFFHAGPTPRETPHARFYRELLASWPV